MVNIVSQYYMEFYQTHRHTYSHKHTHTHTHSLSPSNQTIFPDRHTDPSQTYLHPNSQPPPPSNNQGHSPGQSNSAKSILNPFLSYKTLLLLVAPSCHTKPHLLLSSHTNKAINLARLCILL